MLWLEKFLADQRQNAFLWVPVLIGTGTGTYFALRVEPSWMFGAAVLAACVIAGIALTAFQRRMTPAILLVVAFGCMALGWNVAQWRTMGVSGPVIAKPIGPVTVAGTIVTLDALEEGRGTRVILRDVAIKDVSLDDTPQLVRLSVRKDEGLKPGQRIRVLAGLNPPSPPVMPGSFDFQRHMYFMRIGALGFAYKQPEIVGQDQQRGIGGWLESFRQRHALHVREVVKEPQAAIVSALLLGERAAIPEGTWQDIRAAGLAHVISISGLHIGLIAGGIFVVTRFMMALVPRFALNHPIKKYAAVIALAGCTLYAVMVGLSVPTLRSVIMTGFVLLAVMLDRSPFSLRLVAFSALVILMTTPEAMTGPSFQMSFGAVAALIFFFDETRAVWTRLNRRAAWWKKPVIFILGSICTSVVATVATAPYTLYHFQQFPVYSVIGNVAAMPVIGFVIMPAAVMAYILMPLGLEDIALQTMGWGVGIMLRIAEWVAAWPRASLNLPSWPLGSLILFTVAGLAPMLLQGWARMVCIIPLVIGIISIAQYRQPDMLVAQSGKQMMLRLSDERALLANRRNERFAADAWLRAAGLKDRKADVFPKEGTVSDGGNTLSCDPYGCRAKINQRDIGVSFNPRTLAADCGKVDLLISTKPATGCEKGVVVDMWDLRHDGTHAVWIRPKSIAIKTVEGERGERPWTGVRTRDPGKAGASLPASNRDRRR